MNVPILCVLGFAAWTMLLVLAGVAVPRVTSVLTGQVRADAFRSDGPQGSELRQRAHRAHLNAAENLPLFIAVVFAATTAGLESPWIDRLAIVAFGARVVQSIVHVSSASVIAVNLRFTAFLTQHIAFAVIGVAAAQGLLGAK